MDWNQHYWASLVGVLFTVIVGTSGHGRFIDPPSRVSAWRYGCTSCAQASQYIALYTDTQWNCGGMSHQWDSQNGACGVCGDPADGPYDSEAGGPYATGTIVRTYMKGATIQVKAEITASHLGYIVFKLCPVNNMYVRATQECFDKYPLLRSDGKGSRTYIPQRRDVYTVEVVLPTDLTCTQCVMQWHYWTENRWGDCGNGTGALGCGPQETFRACADISISDDGSTVTNPPGTVPPTKTPATTKPSTTKPPTTKPPTTRAPTTTTVPPPTCVAKNKCTKNKGSCILESTTCVGKVIKKACKTSGCKCCKPQSCVAKGKCTKKKGTCIPETTICEGGVIKKGCKTSGCQCCKPLIPCQQISKCISKGGTCISRSLKCNGQVLKKHCNQKGTKCQCCKPLPTTSAPTPAPTTPAPTPVPTTTSPSALGCSIFRMTHSWDYNVQGDITLSFPTTVSSWNLELTFDNHLSDFQVYIMQKDVSSGSKFTLTPFNWNSNQEAGRDLSVFIWITFPNYPIPQIISAKLTGQELC